MTSIPFCLRASVNSEVAPLIRDQTVDSVKRTNLGDRSAAQLAEICDNSHFRILKSQI